MADGSRRVLKYVKEATFGTMPALPSMKIIRNTGGAGIKYDRSMLESNEMRSDRAVADVSQGNKKPALEIPFELSARSFDDFLEAALGASWVPDIAGGSVTADVDATAKTITVTGATFITDGFAVGDLIVTTGFDDAGNNGIFKISALTETVITIAAATGLVTVSGDSGVVIDSYNGSLKCGTELGSFSIEEGFLDISSFVLMKGAKINTFSLDVKPDAIITGNFATIGKSVDAPTAVTAANADIAANTKPVFNSFTGSIKEGGTTIAIVTGLTLQLSNSLTPDFVVLQDEAYGIGAGRTRVTGELSVYLPDDSLLKKYINGTETSLEFTLGDVEGNTYTFLMSKVKYTSESKNIPEGSIVQSLGYMALHDVTNTTLKVTRVGV